jgi:predicted NBD/HSP70 family sugar kinase
VRRHNLALVLGAVHAAGRTTRAQVAQATGLTRATVSVLAEQLIVAGLVDELAPDRGTPGRPGSPLRLHPSGPGGLGVEVNVDYLAACVVGLDGTVRAQVVAAFDARAGAPRATLRRAARLADRARAEAGIPVSGAGLALPGLVDLDGVLRRAPNLPQWNGFAAAETLASLLGVPVEAGNEANLAAIAEAGELRDFVHVSGEVGVGGGVVRDGRLYAGVGGFAGELGHVVVDPGGPSCSCGGSGCLEQFAGLDVLLRDARCADLDALVGRAAEPPVGTVLAAAGRALGVALAAAVNLLDVHDIVLGGAYARLAPWLVPPLQAELARRVVSPASPRVHVSALGPYAAGRGAAGSVWLARWPLPTTCSGRLSALDGAPDRTSCTRGSGLANFANRTARRADAPARPSPTGRFCIGRGPRVLLASVPGAIRVVVLCSRSADRVIVGSHAARAHRPDRRIFAGLACGKGCDTPDLGDR